MPGKAPTPRATGPGKPPAPAAAAGPAPGSAEWYQDDPARPPAQAPKNPAGDTTAGSGEVATAPGPRADRKSSDRGGGAGSGRGSQPTGRPARPVSVSSTVDSGAGFVLGLLFWGWVALPFVKGGPAEVKKVLMAKFLNKHPDGTWMT